MKEYTIKGTIIITLIDSSTVGEGSVCMIQEDDIYSRVTLSHMNVDGDWIVDGDYAGVIDRHTLLYRLSALTDNAIYPIEMKYWESIIQKNMLDDMLMHEFKIVPHKFKDGKYVHTCANCMASFTATHSQPICKTCCVEASVAHLNNTAVVKSKKIENNTVVQIARLAYTMGVDGKTEAEFINFLKKNKLWQ